MLNAKDVQEVLMQCLFTEEEAADPAVVATAVPVEGITMNVGLHPDRLAKYKDQILNWITELHPNFFTVTEKGGGGWSFLNLFETRNGVQWGEHKDMQNLCFLAIGIRHARWQLPRSIWSALPGGMPYIEFSLATEFGGKESENNPI